MPQGSYFSIYGGKFAFQIDSASRIVGSKFTVFALYLRAIFQVQASCVLTFGGAI